MIRLKSTSTILQYKKSDIYLAHRSLSLEDCTRFNQNQRIENAYIQTDIQLDKNSYYRLKISDLKRESGKFSMMIKIKNRKRKILVEKQLNAADLDCLIQYIIRFIPLNL